MTHDNYIIYFGETIQQHSMAFYVGDLNTMHCTIKVKKENKQILRSQRLYSHVSHELKFLKKYSFLHHIDFI